VRKRGEKCQPDEMRRKGKKGNVRKKGKSNKLPHRGDKLEEKREKT
jgi:hypothetical protein